jgi:flagellar protein FliS
MSYAAQASRYREMEVLGASRGQLVVLLYDHLLVSLRRARLAADSGNVELRTASLDKCRAVVSELLVTLDFERGGELARNLSALYTFLLSELVDVGVARDASRLDRLTEGVVAELRDAFVQVAATAPVGASDLAPRA